MILWFHQKIYAYFQLVGATDSVNFLSLYNRGNETFNF